MRSSLHLMAAALALALGTAGYAAAARVAVTQITDTNTLGASCSSPPLLSADGSRVAFFSICDLTGDNAGHREIFLFDVATSTLTQATSGPDCGGLNQLAISADGGRIAFLSTCDLGGTNPNRNPEVFRLNTATGTIMQLTESKQGGFCHHFCDFCSGNRNPAISGDGQRIAFDSNCDFSGFSDDGNVEVYELDLSGQTLNPGQLTPTTGCSSVAPRLNRDGSRIIFSSACDLTGDGGGTFIRGFPSGVMPLKRLNAPSSAPLSISGDAHYIAFVSGSDPTGANPDASGEIFLLDTATNTLAQLTENRIPCSLGQPYLSDDGTRLVFVSRCDLTGRNPNHRGELFELNTTTRAIAQVTTGGAFEFPLRAPMSASADLSRFAFQAFADMNPARSPEIFVVSLIADDDGVTDAIEDAAPNHGDGDNSGVRDSLETNVVSLPTFAGTSYLTLVATGSPGAPPGCSTLLNVEALDGRRDPGFVYPFGMVALQVDHCPAPFSTTITLILHGSAGSGLPLATYRKIGLVAPNFSGPPEFYTLPGATFGEVSIPGEGAVRTVGFTLTDNHLGDGSGMVGTIVDPGGPAVSVTFAPVASPRSLWMLALALTALAARRLAP